MADNESRLKTLEQLVREFLEVEDALNVMTSEGTVKKLQHRASVLAQLRQAARP